MKRLRALLPGLCVFILLTPAAALSEMYGLVDLNYQKTTTSTDTSSSDSRTITQGYTVGLSKRLTDTITLRADARITETDTNGAHTESIYPTFTLNYSPPTMYYFTFNFTRTDIAPSESSRLASSNLNVAFLLPADRWPSLGLFYNRFTNQDYLTPHKIDNISTNLGLNSTYTLTPLETETRLNYSFSMQNTEDRVTQTKMQSPTHTGSVDMTRYFLDKKLRTSLNMGYSWSEVTNTSLAGATRFEQTFTAVNGLYKNNPNAATGALEVSSGNALIDNDTNTAAKAADGVTNITLNTSYQNIGVQLQSAQSVAKILLYIKTDASNITNNVMSTSSNFNFELYKSDDGTAWTSLGAISPTFDDTLSRFVFTFTETSAKYFKVVNKSSPQGVPDIYATEIQALGYITSTPVEEIKYTVNREFFGFNMAYNPFARLSMGYNLNYDHTTQGINDNVSSTMNHGVNLNYIAWQKYLTVSTSYTTSTNSSTQGTTTATSNDTAANSYTLTLSTNPLPTLTGNVNYSHINNLLNGEDSSATQSVGGNLFMNLYRGMDLGVGSSFSDTKSYTDNSVSGSWNHYANLNLLPLKDLSIVLNTTYYATDTKKDGETTSSTGKTVNASFSYTPTRKIYFSAVYSFEPDTAQSYSVTWLPTRTIQMDARFGLGKDSENMGATFSWSPITKMTMFLGYSRTKSTGDTKSDTDTVFARASLRF